MQVHRTEIPGVIVIDPQVHEDHRGFFMESYQKRRYAAAGLDLEFVQDNHSQSGHGTLRGLHYQLPHAQGKLLRVVRGEVYDVIVDLRQNGPTFGQWMGVQLCASNRRQVYLPPGMAHGFCVVSDVAEIIYRCTDYYYPEHEHVLRWDDPDLAIDWPIEQPLLSQRDQNGTSFRDAPGYARDPSKDRSSH